MARTPAARVEEARDRGIISIADWRSPSIRRTTAVVHAVLLALLVLVGLGPMLWLAKSAVTPTQDTRPPQHSEANRPNGRRCLRLNLRVESSVPPLKVKS